MTRLARVVDEGRQLRVRLEESTEALAQLRILCHELPFEDGHRAQGEQAHHGAHLQTLGPAVRQPEHVVEEPVLLVPHPHVLAGADHRRCDPQEMLDELDAHVEIGWPFERQLRGDLEHVLGEERHPGGAVGLLQVPAGRQRRAAVEDADIVQSQEAALEDVVAGAVLAVHPPGEVQRQLVEGALEPFEVTPAAVGLSPGGT
jgi:hypothetical protein